MTHEDFLQILIFLMLIVVWVKPLGWYLARVYDNKPCGLDRIISPIEHFIYRGCRIHPTQEMGWKTYLTTLLIFNFCGLLLLYAIQRLQFILPFNPQHFPAVSPDVAFNTAISFTTNTDWQIYSGESSLSYFTQMVGLTVQNFLSAATSMAVLVAFCRGIARHETNNLGNFWVDMTRTVLYVLLPLSIMLAILLSTQGVIQNILPYQKVSLIQPISQGANLFHQQEIPMGPVASQVAIKQLGSNGGGFFNANAAHPFENPTPLSNLLEMVAILLIPAALCYTFGMLVKDRRQGLALFVAMFLIFIPLVFLMVWSEVNGNPGLSHLGILGGNMEGKETRLGVVNSAIWAISTTVTSHGSVNAMHDSFMPLSGLMMLWAMHLGEVIFGGVGSGLSSMLILVIITVFVAGLMIGRTPEYLGKKIEPFEMKMASITILLLPLIVLILSAVAVVTQAGIAGISNQGPHGFSQVLYAFTSMGANNGSSFSGLNAGTPFYSILGGIEMLIVRFWTMISILAMAGSLVRKKIIPVSTGTLATHNPIFIVLLISMILIIGALTFFPALALGPIVEHLMLWRHYG